VPSLSLCVIDDHTSVIASIHVKTAALVALPHPTPAKLHKSPAAAGRMWVAAL